MPLNSASAGARDGNTTRFGIAPRIPNRYGFRRCRFVAAGLYLPLGINRAVAADAPQATPEVNAWVVVEPDDTVVIRIARSEMGQGTLTGLAQLVAEELECDWSKVTTEYPTPGESLARDRIWGSFSTGGSQGIRGSHRYMREGGALARVMLIAAAADGWGVAAQECSASNSVITHGPTGRTTTFGEVATAASGLVPPAEVELKDPAQWKLAGKPVKRLDTLEKLTGKQVYGTDLQLPGMVNAAIKACPVFGGTLAKYDDAEVRTCRACVRSCASAMPRLRSWQIHGGRPIPRSMHCP